MTGAELKSLRRAQKLSRAAMAAACDVHPDTVEYWERKPVIDYSSRTVARMMGELGLGKWREYQVEVAQVGRMAVGFGEHSRMMSAVNEKHTGDPATAPWPHGVLETADLSDVNAGSQTCGAKTRAGHPCKSRAVYESGRCKHHGGMSTGPRTPQGRERIAEAQRQRWARYRLEQGAVAQA